MWYLGTWISGELGSAGWMGQLDDLRGLFQTNAVCIILWFYTQNIHNCSKIYTLHSNVWCTEFGANYKRLDLKPESVIEESLQYQ